MKHKLANAVCHEWTSRSWPGLRRRFDKSTEGSVAIEFALVSGAFFMLLLAIFEIAVIAFADQLLSKATAEAARKAQIGVISNNFGGEAAFREEICNGISPFFDCGKIRLRVTVFDDFAAASTSLAEDIPDDLETYEQFDLGQSNEIVVFRVLYEWDVLLLDPSRFGGNRENGSRLMVSTSVVRNEPAADD